MQYALYADNYNRRQLPNKMAIAKRKLFYAPNQFGPMFMQIDRPIWRETMSACVADKINNSLWMQLVCDAYDKIVFDFRYEAWCFALWTVSAEHRHVRVGLYYRRIYMIIYAMAIRTIDSVLFFRCSIRACPRVLPSRRNITNVFILYEHSSLHDETSQLWGCWPKQPAAYIDRFIQFCYFGMPRKKEEEKKPYRQPHQWDNQI